MRWIILVSMITILIPAVCVASDTPRLVCYFDGKAQHRQGIGRLQWMYVNPTLCTHLIYAMHSNYEQLDFNAFRDLKELNPKLKVLISTANWITAGSDQVLGKGTINQMSNVIADMLRQSSAVDGIDISWPFEEEPYIPSQYHKTYFLNQLKDLRVVLGRQNIISISAPGNITISDNVYDIKKIDELVDFVNLKTYNLGNKSSSGQIDFHAPLYGRRWETDQLHTLNVDMIVNYWIREGLSKSKLNVGIPFFGKSWKMNSSAIYPPANASGPGDPGPITKTPGLLAFYEICRSIRYKTLKPSRVINGENKREGLFAYNARRAGSQWVGYDDPLMVKDKARYIVEKQLGGAVVWDISMDDFRGVCKLGKYPLLATICETLEIKSCAAVPGSTNTSTESTELPPAEFVSTSGCTKNFPKHWVLVLFPFCVAILLHNLFLQTNL